MVPSGAGAAFWFLTAPRPIFGMFAFWTAAALCVAELVVAPALATGRPGVRRRIAILLLAMAASPGLKRALDQVREEGRNPAVALARALLVAPGPDHGFHPRPQPSLETYRTSTGLLLYVPSEGNQCFDAPLPCMPHPAPNLRLRSDREPRAGFSVDGEWQPPGWPHANTSFLSAWRAAREQGADGGE